MYEITCDLHAWKTTPLLRLPSSGPFKVSSIEKVQRLPGKQTMTADLKELGLVWTEPEKIIRECKKWRSNAVMALSPSWDDA